MPYIRLPSLSSQGPVLDKLEPMFNVCPYAGASCVSTKRQKRARHHVQERQVRLKESASALANVKPAPSKGQPGSCHLDTDSLKPELHDFSTAISGDLLQTVSNEQLSVLLQALSDNVDEWPLCVALEEMCPDLENGSAERSRVPLRPDVRLFVFKVDDVVCLFYDTSNPM